MEDEQYCLKWNNHQATLLTNLTCLMDTERLYDCFLSAEGKTIKSHQVVISACSPYLERLLNDCRQPGLMPILVFSELAYDELVALREYMYKGEVNIRQNALDSFLKAAHSLQIKGLADGGGGGGEEPGGGKRKAENDMNNRRRRRRESTESDDRHSTQSPVQPPIVKKQNVFNNSSNYENSQHQVKMEPIEQVTPVQVTPQIKAEHHDPPPETHDLTGADDDFDDDTGYEMPGTSQPDLSQDMSNWQMDNSMNSEDFVAAQAMAQQPGQSSQGLRIDLADTFIHNIKNGDTRNFISDTQNIMPDIQNLLPDTQNIMLSTQLHTSDTQNKLYYCDCGKSYKTKGGLHNHKTLECGREASLSCKLCSYKCKQKGSLKRHCILVHKTMEH